MNITVFLAGFTMASFAGAGVFFFKLWKASRDRFFVFFGGACWLFAIERVAALFVQGALDPDELQPLSETSFYIYFIRLLAFVLILIAIIEKNRTRKGN